MRLREKPAYRNSKEPDNPRDNLLTMSALRLASAVVAPGSPTRAVPGPPLDGKLLLTGGYVGQKDNMVGLDKLRHRNC
jgi:hypothetical protein